MSQEDNSPRGKDRVPTHVAIIMDGNGRWAKERGKPRIFGHSEGAQRVRDVVEAAQKAGVRILTLYAFSSENWNRPKEEISALMGLLVSSLGKYGEELVANEIKFETIGDIEALPRECVEALVALKERTKNFTRAMLVLALNYGARAETVGAVRKIAEKVKLGKIAPEDIDWDTIADNLQTREIPDPDLIIRTSGEQRLSNYLLLQAAYSEFYFTDVYWPDFGADEFAKAIEEYKRRERRYGKTSDQI